MQQLGATAVYWIGLYISGSPAKGRRVKVALRQMDRKSGDQTGRGKTGNVQQPQPPSAQPDLMSIITVVGGTATAQYNAQDILGT